MDWFVYLSKLLPTLVYPVGLAFLLLLLALIFQPSKKWRLTFLILALLALWIPGTPFPGAWMTRALETAYPPLPKGEKAPVIVVLGGGTESHEYPRQDVEIGGAGDRILYAAQLYHDNVGEKILFGGAYYEVLAGEKASIASEMANIAERLGVDPEDILLQETSVNTAEEAVADAAILAELEVDKIILVTSATHMYRSVKLFEKQGLTVIPAPTDFGYSDAEWKNQMTLTWEKWYTYIIPQSGNIRAYETALKEFIGIFIYRLRGWL